MYTKSLVKSANHKFVFNKKKGFLKALEAPFFNLKKKDLICAIKLEPFFFYKP